MEESKVQIASVTLSKRRRVDLISETNVMAGEPRSLNDFPDEIILKILSHFGPEDLGFITAKVCARWNAISKDVSLWKTLSYSCDHTSELDRVVQVLTVAPVLQSLIVSGRMDVVRIVGIVIDRHVDIRKLILKNCNFGEDGTVLLNNVVNLYPDLEALSLDGCHPAPSAFSLIPRLKKLTELNLSHCEELSAETVHLIVDSCQHLKKLSLDEVKLCDDDVIKVIKKLGKQLTTLVLDGGFLTEVAHLYLNKCDRLQELGVSFCVNMTDRGLLEGIGPLQELTSLRLYNGINLTARILSTFLHQSSLCSVVLLDLSCCSNLDDEGLNGIAERCVNLKELVVAGCKKVTDAGISIVIRNCGQLRVLDLNHLQNITGDGWLPLVPSLLPHLRLLSLVVCNRKCDKYIAGLLAAATELVVISRTNYIMGAERNKQLKITDKKCFTKDYDIIRQWALDR